MKTNEAVKIDGDREFKIRYVGLSSDGRTNRWRVTCSCGYVFEPPTTMLSGQTVACDKCERSQIVNYNNL